MLNLKFVKFAPVFFVSAFVLLFCNISLAQERTGETLTKIEIKDVKIEKSNTEIKIRGALFNPSKNIITPEITHLLILKTIDPLIKPKSDVDLPLSLIVAADEGKNYFSLKPNEQKTFSYVLPFSPYIPQANYDIYLGFIRSNGQAEARYEDTVKNLGSSQKDGFLAFDQESCFLLNKEGKKFGNNDGPAFLSGESPEARCLVKNVGDKEIEVSPKILWKEVYVFGKPLDGKLAMENPNQKILFKPWETKSVSLFMPKAEKPQTYQSLVSFESKDGASRSFNMFFRWTIAGESARVKNVAQISQLKNSYAKGEKIDLSVDYFGSADLFWTGAGQKVSNLSDLKMKAVIKDRNGDICGGKEETLADITDGEIKNKVIEVVLDKKCGSASYNVSLVSGQRGLAEESGELPKVVNERNILPYLYFGAPALLVILLAFSFFRKKRIVPVSLLIILPIAGVTMFFGSVLAGTQTYPEWGGATSTYRWGGDWTLGSGTRILYSNPEGGGGLNKLKVYSAEAGFNGYFDNSGDLNDVYIDYRAVDNSCANTGMKVQIEMFIKADGLSEQKVSFAKGGSKDWKNKIRLWYNNVSGDIVERRFNVNSNDISAFYNANKTAKNNPKLVIYVKQVGYNSHKDKYSEGYFSVANKKLRTENDAFDMSDSIKIEIPLKLPAPSVNLSVNPSTVTADGTVQVTLDTTDLSDKIYTNRHDGVTGTNGFDKLTFDSTPSSGTKSQTKTVSNVWISGNSNSSQTNNLQITYTKDLGQYIGRGTYTAKATVTVKPPTSSSSSLSVTCSASSSSVDVGSNVTFTATASGGASTYTYAWTGTDITSGASGTTGSTITKSYSTTGTKTAKITVTDNVGAQTNYTCSVNVTIGGGGGDPPTGGACNNNGVQDNGETGVDCGGGNCSACGTTTTTTPSCSDGIQNQDETGVDTGGVCTTTTTTTTKTLTINIAGSTSGTVSDENGVTLCHGSAGASCSLSYTTGTVLSALSAAGDSGYSFDGWGGDCSISGNNCSVTLDDNRTISASFGTNSGPITCTSNCDGDGGDPPSDVIGGNGGGGGGGGGGGNNGGGGGGGGGALSSSSSSRPSVIIQEI